MKLTNSRNQCSACKEYFNSTSAFDFHREGSDVYRRCLEVDEMKAIGMVKNADGFWIRRSRTAAGGTDE